LFYNLHSVR